MEIYDTVEKTIGINKRIVISWQWRSWTFSISWRLPVFLDLWLEEEEYAERVYRPDPATYPLIYQARVPIYYDEYDD